ncbi:MAG: RDD family protein [Actinobacteria bacterium]|nr:RDD family protein [Actinomycetota bacterium]
MTAVLDADVKDPGTLSTDTSPAARPGAWVARAGAFAIDVLLGLGVIATMVLLGLAAPRGGWLWWVFTGTAAAVFVAMVVNRLLLPTTTGWSLGRAVFGLRVVTRSGGPAGVLRLLARDVAHLLDTAALFVGWLWPLWDRRGRTFADMLLRTEVHAVAPPARSVTRTAAAVLLAAALLCGAAVGLGYVGVYRADRAVEQARAQIAEQGPRIVEQMLSYGVNTMPDDFARAQSLATDAYRPQLAEQQDAVRKGVPSANEYWAVSSAVLSASKNAATMLLAMQGQRGSDPKDLKFITATVRVDFQRSGDGQWRVANLTVLTRPQLNGAGR